MFLTADVRSFFKWRSVVAFNEIALRELERRANGRWKPVSVKHIILGYFKEGVILVCQTTFKIKEMASLYSLDLFAIHLSTLCAYYKTKISGWTLTWTGPLIRLRHFLKQQKINKCNKKCQANKFFQKITKFLPNVLPKLITKNLPFVQISA